MYHDFDYFHDTFYQSMPQKLSSDGSEQTMLLVNQGDLQAFSDLYDKYAPMVMGVLSRLVCDTKIAEDILQQVFSKIWKDKTIPNLSKECRFSKIIKIARDTLSEPGNRQIKLYREFPKADKTIFFYQKGDVAPEQNLITGSVFGFNMDNTSKEALELVYFMGYSFCDAAAILNISISSLKERVRVAIKYLKGANV